jgi:hypothetical protein
MTMPVVVTACPARAATTAASVPTRPNIVFTLTDDLDAATYVSARLPALPDLMSTQG